MHILIDLVALFCMGLIVDSEMASTAGRIYKAVAAKAELLKDEKHSDLLHTHEFTPAAVESSGVFGPQLFTF